MLERQPPRFSSVRRRGARRRKRGKAAKLAWLVIVLGVISSLALAIYGVRSGLFAGDKAWRELSASLKGRGEPLQFPEVVPPPLPDVRNFFSDPVFAGIEDGAPSSALIRKAEAPVGGKSAGELLGAVSRPDGSADLSRAAAVFEDGLETEYLLDADRVLAGMHAAGLNFSSLREAARRPEARFHVDYSQPEPPLPHLSRLEMLADWLALDALARIDIGNGTEALDDLLLIGRLADSVASEPFLPSQILRRTLYGLIAGCVRVGLRDAIWSDDSLSKLSSLLGGARLIAGFGLAVRGERAILNSIVDGGLPAPASGLSGWLEDAPADSRAARDRRMVANSAVQAFLDHLTDSAGIAPAALLPPAEAETPPRLVALAKEAETFVQVQTYVLQARAACALTRYRSANGSFPDSLERLVPDFLPAVPADPMTGAALRYEHSGGGFALIGAGWEKERPWIWKS